MRKRERKKKILRGESSAFPILEGDKIKVRASNTVLKLAQNSILSGILDVFCYDFFVCNEADAFIVLLQYAL